MAHSSTKRRLRSEINKNENLKEEIKEIIHSLNGSVSDMNDGVDRIRNEYVIDNEDAVITTSINYLKGEVSKTSNYLNNKVLPEIRSIIKDLKDELRRLEEEDD
mgnify:FL=1